MKHKNDLLLPDAYQFFDQSFGYVVPFEKIKADPDSYSSVFCEGSVALKSLLQNLWKHDVETRGCCKGHECVHYYVKDSIFGRKKYYIDEKTYRSHAGSKHYHEVTSQAYAYLAFQPNNFGPAQELCRKIEAYMKQQLPELTYVTNAFPDLITISLDRYVLPPQREQFFSTLSSVLCHCLLHDKQGIAHDHMNRKGESLDQMIQSASSRKLSSNLSSNRKDRVSRPVR